MSSQPRVVKVLALLLISMTTGAVVLMAMGYNPPSAGPFCLSSYYLLDPVEKAVVSRACQSPERWNSIELFYSRTRAGNIEQLAILNGLAGSEDLNCHFVVCNGLGGNDGQIQPTEKWQQQWSAIPDQNWQGSGQTIRICIVADGKTVWPTDYQMKRIETLVQALCRRFQIRSEAVYLPSDCQ